MGSVFLGVSISYCKGLGRRVWGIGMGKLLADAIQATLSSPWLWTDLQVGLWT